MPSAASIAEAARRPAGAACDTRVMGNRDDTWVPELPIPPALAVVILGLLASMGWGIGDFGGGLTSRRAPVLGVLMGSQIASLVVGVPILFVLHEPAMRPLDIALSIGGGILAATGLAFLYRGLSVGRWKAWGSGR